MTQSLPTPDAYWVTPPNTAADSLRNGRFLAEGYTESKAALGGTGQVSAVVSMLADKAIALPCK